MDIPEEPKIVADPTMPTTPIFTASAAPTLGGPNNFLTLTLSLIKTFVIAFISFLRLLLTGLCCALCSLLGPSLVEVALTSWFEIGSNSATVPDPVSEAAAFFTCFDQAETNDLDPLDFWGARSPYVDFHGFQVPEECVTHLEVVYSSCRDFMQGFPFGRSMREHLLKLLRSVMNDIEHNLIDTVSVERILQWRVAI